MEAVGFAGGLWLFWEETTGGLEILESHQQFIHVKVKPNGGGKVWFFTVVYGAPRRQARLALWAHLERLALDLREEEWLLMGDFNAMLFPSDKKGGGSVQQGALNEF